MKMLLILLLLISPRAFALDSAHYDNDNKSSTDEAIGHRADRDSTPERRERDRQAADRIGRAVREHGCTAGCTVATGVISGAVVSGPAVGGIIAGAGFICERACP